MSAPTYARQVLDQKRAWWTQAFIFTQWLLYKKKNQKPTNQSKLTQWPQLQGMSESSQNTGLAMSALALLQSTETAISSTQHKYKHISFN